MNKDYKKLYEEALERAKIKRDEYMRLDGPESYVPQDIEYIFPELIESEDEKIRKWIINEIKIKHHNLDEDNVDFVDKAIAWLGKQGKKRSCRNCQTFQDLHQNCPYSPIYGYTDLEEAHKHLDDETNCKFWLKKQKDQKATWSEEDEIGFNDTMWAIEQARTITKDENDMGNLWYAERWLKSLKERIEENTFGINKTIH